MGGARKEQKDVGTATAQTGSKPPSSVADKYHKPPKAGPGIDSCLKAIDYSKAEKARLTQDGQEEPIARSLPGDFNLMEHEWDFIFQKSSGSEEWKRSQMDAIKARAKQKQEEKKSRREAGKLNSGLTQSASGPQLTQAADALAEHRKNAAAGGGGRSRASGGGSASASSVVPEPPYANIQELPFPDLKRDQRLKEEERRERRRRRRKEAEAAAAEKAGSELAPAGSALGYAAPGGPLASVGEEDALSTVGSQLPSGLGAGRGAAGGARSVVSMVDSDVSVPPPPALFDKYYFHSEKITKWRGRARPPQAGPNTFAIDWDLQKLMERQAEKAKKQGETIKDVKPPGATDYSYNFIWPPGTEPEQPKPKPPKDPAPRVAGSSSAVGSTTKSDIASVTGGMRKLTAHLKKSPSEFLQAGSLKTSRLIAEYPRCYSHQEIIGADGPPHSMAKQLFPNGSHVTFDQLLRQPKQRRKMRIPGL